MLEVIREIIMSAEPITAKMLFKKHCDNVSQREFENFARELRRVVRELRLKGVPIMSGVNGYSYPNDKDSILRLAEMFKSVGKKYMQVYSKLKKTSDTFSGRQKRVFLKSFKNML